MTFLPIIERQLRVLARKPATYWLRTSAALSLTLMAMMMIWDGRWQSLPSMSRELFTLLSGTAFFAALIVGAVITADSVSSEKRDGTLGLLFLTDLKGIDVVLGKLVAHGLTGLYVLCAGLPVMALPVLMGGVTGEQIWQMGLVVLNSMFFALCAGMFVSVIVRGARGAILGALALVAWFTFGILAVEALTFSLLHLPYREPMLARIGPIAGFIAAMESGRGLPNATEIYWQSVLSTHALAWFFLIAAARIIPRVWQERGLTVKQIKFRERMTRWSVGRAEDRKAYRQRLLELNPICWLDDRYRLQKSLLWAAFLASLTLGMWLFSLDPTGFLREDVVIPTILITQGILAAWVAFAATHRLSEDKRSGALELLLATPIPVDDIIKGRLLALRRQFGWVVICVFSASALMYAGMIYFQWDFPPYLVTMGITGFLVFALYLRTIAITGQWFAMVSPTSLAATMMTLIVVVGLHWAMFLGCVILISWFEHFTRFSWFTQWHVLFLWLAFGGGNCLFWPRWSQRHLNLYFRHVACRLPMRPNFWQRLAARFGVIRAAQGVNKSA